MQETKQIHALLRDWVEASPCAPCTGWRCLRRARVSPMPQLSLLMRLHHAGGCEVHDIGRVFGVSAGAAGHSWTAWCRAAWWCARRTRWTAACGRSR